MRIHDSEQTKKLVNNFYTNIGNRLKAMGIRWKDLAKLIGIDHRTLSSMKCQNQNPSVTVALRIADMLQCSIEELMQDPPVNGFCSLDDLHWFLYRLLSNDSYQINDQLADIASTLAKDKELYMRLWRNRTQSISDDLKQRIHDIDYPDGETFLYLDHDGTITGYTTIKDVNKLPSKELLKRGLCKKLSKEELEEELEKLEERS